MTTRPRIRVDFQNADGARRVRLNTRSSLDDLKALGPDALDGLKVRLESEELAAAGVIRHSQAEDIWVAELDWKAVEDL